MKYILWLLRIIVGVLFIFSGLVKANDPLGLSYKMNEFFEVWGTLWAVPYSLTLSVLMIGFELIAGIALLLGAFFRLFSFLLLLLNVFFTFLTAYVYFTDKIKECGCFGDCFKLTNAQTFWKDVILTAFVLVLFAYRNQIKPLFNNKISFALMAITCFGVFFIQSWTLHHLPYHDCLPYKLNANISEKMKVPPGAIPDEYETVMIYEKGGVKKEFTMQNYPWQDSTWKFVDRKDKLVKKGNAEPEIHDFAITDFDGNDHTEELLTTPGFTFLLFIKDPETASNENLDKLNALVLQARQWNIPLYIISSASKEITDKFLSANKIERSDVLQVDNTVSKTALRSNPGLMLLEKGTIRGKWSYKDYPQNIFDDNGKLKSLK